MNLDEIISLYSKKAKKAREKIKQVEATYQQISELTKKYKKLIEELISLNILEEYPGSFASLDQVNEFLDTTIKYASFWLAVHYYECRWLSEKRLSENTKGQKFRKRVKSVLYKFKYVGPLFCDDLLSAAENAFVL
ncbi:hypothetical protein QKW52_03800 [Bacillus sonorensis]|nr:hypothetical protein [Bacillus sonorensis]